MSHMDNYDDLHTLIESGNIDEVENFLASNCPDDHYYNAKNESAAATGIKYEQTAIYDLLIKRKVLLGPHEKIVDLVVGEPSIKKRRLDDIHIIHRNNTESLELGHITALRSASKLSHNSFDEDEKKRFDFEISQAFHDLNNFIFTQIILKISSTIANLKIVFDFNRDSVNEIDPNKSELTRGTTYFPDNHIYVGAKGLLNEDSKRGVLGTLIHELCHVVMKFVYNNNCKPYLEDDHERKKEFEAVLKATRTKYHLDQIVQNVFENYESERCQAELIARVPHLAAVYKNNIEKYAEVSEHFHELFYFYEHRTMADLKFEYPRLEAMKAIRASIVFSRILFNLEASEICFKDQAFLFNLETSDKILHVSSNWPEATMKAIFQQVKNEFRMETNIFVQLNCLENVKMFEDVKNAFNLCIEQTIVIDCAGSTSDKILKLIQKLKSHQMIKRIAIVADESVNIDDTLVYNKLTMKHSWNELSKDYQRTILCRANINFQGKRIKLKDLIEDDEIEKITNVPLDRLLKQLDINISSKITFEKTAVYVERKIFPFNSKTNGQKNSRGLFDSNDSSDSNDSEYDVEEISNILTNHKVVLLMGEPGIGKSTTLRMLAASLNDKHSSRWIVFMRLTDHFKVFKKHKNLQNLFDERNEIPKFFIKNILKADGFEAELFTCMFRKGLVTFVMDGFDEICPSFKSLILSMINGIKTKSDNKMLISTRPHLIEDLEKKIKLFTFKLKPFTNEDVENFFVRYIKVKNPEDQENVAKKIVAIEKLMMSFRRDPISNPLVLSIIAELIDDNSEIDISNAKLYEIYDKFAMKIIMRSMNKGQDAKLSVAKTYEKVPMTKFYQKCAFDELFKSMPRSCKCCLCKFKLLCFKDVPILNAQLTVDDVCHLGLMYSDEAETFQFVHKTYAEFFIAKFFIDFFMSLKSSDQCETEIILMFFSKIMIEENSDMNNIKKFFDDALEFYDVWERTESVSLVLLRRHKATTESFRHKMEALAWHGFMNIFMFLWIHLVEDHQSFWLGLLINYDSSLYSLFSVMVQSGSLQNNKAFWTFLEANLGSDFLKETFLNEVNSWFNIFHSAIANNDSDVFDFYLSKTTDFPISDKVSEKFRIYLDGNIKKSKFDACFELINRKLNRKQMKNLVVSMGVNLWAYVNDLASVEIICSLIEQSELIDFLSKTGYCNATSLMIFAARATKPLINCLWKIIESSAGRSKQKEILLQLDYAGKTPFQVAMRNKNQDLFLFFEDVCKELFGEEKIKEMALDQLRRGQGSELFHREFEKRTTLSLILDQNVTQESDIIFIKLCPSCKYRLKSSFTQSFSKSTLSELFPTAVSACDKKTIESLWKIIETKFNLDEQREILLPTFDKAIVNDDDEAFGYLRNLYVKIFSEEKLIDLISNRSEKSHQNLDLKRLIFVRLKKTFQQLKCEEKFREVFSMHWIEVPDRLREDKVKLLVEDMKEKSDHVTFRDNLIHTNESGKFFLYFAFEPTIKYLKDLWTEVFGDAKDEAIKKLIFSNLEETNGLIQMVVEFYDRDKKFFQAFLSCFEKISREKSYAKRLNEMLVETYNKNENFLMKVVETCDLRTIETIWNCVESITNLETRKKILLQSICDNKRITIFNHGLANQNQDSFKFVEKIYKETLGNEKFMEIVFEGNSLCHVINFGTDYNLQQIFQYFKENYAEKKSRIEEIMKLSLIFAVKKLGKEKFELFWEGVREVISDVETLKEILLYRNKNGINAFHISLFDNCDVTFNYIKNVFQDTLGYSQTKELIFNNFKDNIFFHLIENRYESFFNVWDRLPVVLNTEYEVRINEILTQRNQLGLTLIDVADRCELGNVLDTLHFHTQMQFVEN